MPIFDTFTIALIVFTVAVAALAFGMYRRPGMLKGCCGWIAGFRGSRQGHGGESPPGATDQALRDCLERAACDAETPSDRDEAKPESAPQESQRPVSGVGRR